MIPLSSAMSPLIRTGRCRSASGSPGPSRCAAKWIGVGYSSGFGSVNRRNPVSASGLIAMIAAPFFFACSSEVSIRG